MPAKAPPALPRWRHVLLLDLLTPVSTRDLSLRPGFLARRVRLANPSFTLVVTPRPPRRRGGGGSRSGTRHAGPRPDAHGKSGIGAVARARSVPLARRAHSFEQFPDGLGWADGHDLELHQVTPLEDPALEQGRVVALHELA